MTGEEVILEEVRKVSRRVDDVEKAINEFKDVPPGDIKKTNDLVIGVGGLSDQVKAMREELNEFKKIIGEKITEAVKEEMKPLLKTMVKIEKKGKVTINEVRHNWFAWWPIKKRLELE